MASRNIFLPKESNRRIPNGTYGGVRGMNNLYSIAFPRAKGAVVWFSPPVRAVVKVLSKLAPYIN